jgi:hypothetical protein
MSPEKVGFLKKVHDTRRRIHGVASAAAAVAEMKHFEATNVVSVRSEQVDGLMTAAPERFERARGPVDFLRFDSERQLAETMRAEAQQQAKLTLVESEKARAILLKKGQDLRVSERVLERAQAELEHAESKAEQRAHDDLSARRSDAPPRTPSGRGTP